MNIFLTNVRPKISLKCAQNVRILFYQGNIKNILIKVAVKVSIKIKKQFNLLITIVSGTALSSNEEHCPLCHHIVSPADEMSWQMHLMGSASDACQANPRRLSALRKRNTRRWLICSVFVYLLYCSSVFISFYHFALISRFFIIRLIKTKQSIVCHWLVKKCSLGQKVKIKRQAAHDAKQFTTLDRFCRTFRQPCHSTKWCFKRFLQESTCNWLFIALTKSVIVRVRLLLTSRRERFPWKKKFRLN